MPLKVSRYRLTGRTLVAVVVALALIGIGLALARFSIQQTRQSAVETLATLLRSDRPEVRSAAAAKLRELGRDGIAPLVQALRDERETVFFLASTSIDQALVEWQFLPAAETRERMAKLAAELEHSIAELPAERRFVARRWAEQMVVMPGEDGIATSTELLASCEVILRQSPVQTEVAVAPPSRKGTNYQRPFSIVKQAESSTPQFQPSTAQPGNQTKELPLVIESYEADPQIALKNANERANATASGTQPQEPQRLVAPSAQPLVPRELSLTMTKPRDLDPPPVDESARLLEQSDLEVMQKLHDLDAILAEAAEAELRRRGYRTVDLPICRALVDPDPEVRRQLAESLPFMHSIDARPWLLQLAQDSDVEVRRAADGILRTSRDAALQRRLR